MDFNNTKAWPFIEAQKVLKRLKGKDPEKGYILFETGYGPSGLPHIGTFCENVRTVMVKQAFEKLCDIPTKLIMFSDDMDGMRKVAPNLPNQEMLKENLHRSLTSIPDPFGVDESFAHHNNRRLREFLDSFGVDYEFMSSTEKYKAGDMNKGLLAVLENYDAVMDIMTANIGEERRQTYSPFLPVCPETGHVLQVPVIHTDVAKGTIVYRREDGEEIETSVTDGHCKLQWKPDWAMRWFVLGVDYEMCGKDLIDSVRVSSQVCRAIGGRAPENLIYEHFVDEEGAKISKSKGNGVSIEQWLSYSIQDTLGLYTYRQPTRQKKIFLSLIPQVTDEYAKLLKDYTEQTPEEQVMNPVWHLHAGNPPSPDILPISYNMLLNLVSTSAAAPTKEYVWGVIQKHLPEASAETHPVLDELVGGAIQYYNDLVLPTKNYRTPTEAERAALEDLATSLKELTGNEADEDIQTEIYTVGKRHYEKADLKNWFKTIYEVIFGFSQGPRMGGFTKIYGLNETISLIESSLERAAA